MSKTTLTVSLSRPHPKHYMSENGPLFTHLLMPETWEPFLSSWQPVFSVLSPNTSHPRCAPHPSSTVLHPNVGLQTQPNCSLPTFPLASSNPFFTRQPVTFQKYISNHITACWKHLHEAASRNDEKLLGNGALPPCQILHRSLMQGSKWTFLRESDCGYHVTEWPNLAPQIVGHPDIMCLLIWCK